MNANEVIASRANEIATGKRGGKDPIHPNDHVNMEQSSNDVIPTAMHVSGGGGDEGIARSRRCSIWPMRCRRKPTQFDDVVKIGRTHLAGCHADPAGAGTFRLRASGASWRSSDARRRSAACASCRWAARPSARASIRIPISPSRRSPSSPRKTGIDFVEAKNHFEAQAAKDGVVEASGLLKTIAVSLTKIANDIRWLASGPRCGIGEITHPLHPARAARSCRARSIR